MPNIRNNVIFKQASEKEDLSLELEKQEKLYEVEIAERDNKIKHLDGMIDKYKKVIDKIDANFKQLPQEFAIKLMSVEKKLKREKESKFKAQEEVKRLKRELLDKETQWKRQVSAVKNQELKVFAEWDMNCMHTHLDENFRKSG